MLVFLCVFVFCCCCCCKNWCTKQFLWNGTRLFLVLGQFDSAVIKFCFFFMVRERFDIEKRSTLCETTFTWDTVSNNLSWIMKIIKTMITRYKQCWFLVTFCSYVCSCLFKLMGTFYITFFRNVWMHCNKWKPDMWVIILFTSFTFLLFSIEIWYE